MASSTAAINSFILFAPISASLSSRAARAEPDTIGISSPGNSYFESNSLTSISTNSNNSGSST